MGIPTKASVIDLPKQFKIKDHMKEYVWSPHRYEKFIRWNARKVRKELGNEQMSEKDMLDALVGQDYLDWVRVCEKWVAEGKIPAFKSRYLLNQIEKR